VSDSAHLNAAYRHDDTQQDFPVYDATLGGFCGSLAGSFDILTFLKGLDL